MHGDHLGILLSHEFGLSGPEAGRGLQPHKVPVTPMLWVSVWKVCGDFPGQHPVVLRAERSQASAGGRAGVLPGGLNRRERGKGR